MLFDKTVCCLSIPKVKVFDYHGTNEAMQIIEDGKRRFKEKNSKWLETTEIVVFSLHYNK